MIFTILDLISDEKCTKTCNAERLDRGKHNPTTQITVDLTKH